MKSGAARSVGGRFSRRAPLAKIPAAVSRRIMALALRADRPSSSVVPEEGLEPPTYRLQGGKPSDLLVFTSLVFSPLSGLVLSFDG